MDCARKLIEKLGVILYIALCCVIVVSCCFLFAFDAWLYNLSGRQLLLSEHEILVMGLSKNVWVA